MNAIQEKKERFPRKDSVMDRVDNVLAPPSDSSFDLVAEYTALAESYRKLYHKFYKTLVISDSFGQQTKHVSSVPETALSDIRVLKGEAPPLCMVCHRINIADDNWIRLEVFFASFATNMFSDSICPECAKQTYHRLGEQIFAQQKVAGQHGSRKTSREDGADDTLTDMRSVLERAAGENNPLAPDMERIVSRYAKLLRRFNKIVSLSDSYQTQLREFNLRLELMARTDPLTGINNRGYFIELMIIELKRSRRHEHAFSMLMLDLDHFKSVNDTHGHAAGDDALRSLPRVIQASGLRTSDFFGRIGGEEFAIGLPETTIHGAAEVAERIRMNLEKTVLIHHGIELYLTASIGVSEFRIGDTEDTLMQRADQAMYRAKESGRNKVCLSD
jgi:diguanylate cyclase